MYIPKINVATDREEILSFLRQFSFATIVTAKDNFPTATHLPFIVTTRGDDVILTSHFAKANPQWKDLENCEVLVIFSEPHAYISPDNYNTTLNVPTWNYVSIHAYGQGKLITLVDEVYGVLETTINNYETAYLQQWNALPKEFKSKMINGIVAFEIVVTDLQAKKKLSQNKTTAEKQKIIDTLKNSTNTNERLIADFMLKNMAEVKL